MFFPIISLYLVDSNLLQAAYIMKVFHFVLQMWQKVSLGTERSKGSWRNAKSVSISDRTKKSHGESLVLHQKLWCSIWDQGKPCATRRFQHTIICQASAKSHHQLTIASISHKHFLGSVQIHPGSSIMNASIPEFCDSGRRLRISIRIVWVPISLLPRHQILLWEAMRDISWETKKSSRFSLLEHVILQEGSWGWKHEC